MKAELEAALARLSATRREILRQLDEAASLAQQAVRAHERGDVKAAHTAIRKACDLEFAVDGACEALGPLAEALG